MRTRNYHRNLQLEYLGGLSNNVYLRIYQELLPYTCGCEEMFIGPPELKEQLRQLPAPGGGAAIGNV